MTKKRICQSGFVIGVILIIISFSFFYSPIDFIPYYYKIQGEKEKSMAAQFLLDNMGHNYSYFGEGYEHYNNSYRKLGNVPIPHRNDSLQDFLSMNRANEFLRLKSDKKNLTASFIIDHIDHIYDIWSNLRWKDEVDFETFCIYILPYKVSNEHLSEWLNVYHSNYNKLFDHIFFDGGEIFKASDQKIIKRPVHEHRIDSTIKSTEYELVDRDKSIIKLVPGENLLFEDIYCHATSKKMLFVSYTNGKQLSDVKLCINKTDTINVSFKPLDSWLTFPDRSLAIPVSLKEGMNRIEVFSEQDTIGIEHIEIAYYEKFYRDMPGYEIIDGANYVIRNSHNDFVLEVDSGKMFNTDRLNIAKAQESPHQVFNIQNINYGFFKISPTHIDNYSKAVEVYGFSKEEEANVVQFDYYGYPNQEWAIIPIENGSYKIINKQSSKCLDYNPVSLSIYQSEYAGLASQHWYLERVDDTLFYDTIHHVPQNSVLEAACRINEGDARDFDWFFLNPIPDPTGEAVFSTRTGSCKEESHHLLYILRSVGIPSAIDFNPQRPHAARGHYWNSVIGKNNKTIRFQYGEKPGTGGAENPTAKIYRKNYAINDSSLASLTNSNEYIPPLFRDAGLIDVTNEYCITKNVDIELFEFLPKTIQNIYLAVFDNQDWIPISWSFNTNGTASFKSMGLNNLYFPCYYDNLNTLTAAGYPFILHENEDIQQIIPNLGSTQTLVLNRKYPWPPDHHLNYRMDNGRFEGANKADFSDAKELFTFKGKAAPIFYTVKSKNSTAFKYVRYIGADGTYSTINEIKFLDKEGKELQGKPIGTKGSYNGLGNTYEKAFDNDILTFYDGHKPDGTFVGLAFDSPTTIDKIRFIGRNDGNCVEMGDFYELKYLAKHGWQSLSSQTAEHDSLVFENCPTNALFILNNHTKGVEERVFEYVDGQVIWH